MENIKSIADIVNLHKSNEAKRRSVIQIALDHGLEMLHLEEFANIINSTIDRNLSLKMLWTTFHRDIPIYITDELIKLFGYKGELKTKKSSLLKLVKKYNIPIIQLKNEEYSEFTSNPGDALKNEEKSIITQYGKLLDNLYPPITKAQLKSKPTHNLIMPRDLKKLLIVVNTAEGDKTRDYMIALDELFQ